jgi:hypothetical protein
LNALAITQLIGRESMPCPTATLGHK